MNAKDKLSEVQAALAQRGCRDIKFCFSEAGETPVSHAVADVSFAIDAFVNGRVREMPPFGDSVRK